MTITDLQVPELPKTVWLQDFTQASLGSFFVEQHLELVRHCTEKKTWLVWTGTHWEADAGDKRVSMLFQEMISKLIVHFKDGAEGKTEEKAKWWLKAASQISGFRQLAASKNAIVFASHHRRISVAASDLDLSPDLFNAANGTVDLRTGKIQPHDREDLLTRVSSHKYRPEATCPTWLKALDQWMNSDQQMIDYLQACSGYMATGQTNEHALFFCYGAGANGKSVFIKALQTALSPYSMTGSDSLLSNRDGVRPDDVAALAGKRLVVIPEVETTRRFSMNDVKRLTSDDLLSARQLYGLPFTFMPTHTLLLTGNWLPIIAQNDNGTWRRWHILPFEYAVPAEVKDPWLSEKLAKETEGILAWIVAGAAKWYSEGALTHPTKVVEATAAYRTDMDLIGTFIQDCCEAEPDSDIPTGTLYQTFQRYVVENNLPLKHLSKPALARELRQRGWETKKNSTIRWAGWRLAESAPVSSIWNSLSAAF